MIIALDYDGTYTADPVLWSQFIRAARLRGHEVHIVTMRAEHEPVRVTEPVDRTHYTDRRAKRPYMQARGIQVQIWIDDAPEWVLGDAAPRETERINTHPLWAGIDAP